MILHVVNSSPFQSNSLNDCLAQMSPEDRLLLIQDGVVATSVDEIEFKQLALLSKEGRLWVLLDDLNARGLSVKLGQSCDYQQFVTLIAVTKSQIAW